MNRQRFNPNVHALGVPPIPRIQRAARDFAGPREDLIDLSQAVPGYPPPDSLLQALGQAASDPACLGYGPIEGEAGFRAAYAADLVRTHGGTVSSDNILITSGCNQAFVTAALTVAAPGESVLMINPWYFNHQSTLAMFGIDTAHVTVDASTGFLPDPDKVAAAISPEVRALAIVTPNNPTGAVYPATLIRALYELCASRGIWLILDETYQDFLPTAHGPAHDLFDDGPAEFLIGLSSFSKSFCVPGHRLGAVVADLPVIEQMGKIMDNLQICAPRAPQVALAHCLPTLDDWRAGNRDEINRRANALRQSLASLPAWRIDAIGAYFAYVRHPWPEASSVDVAERLARELGMVALPGAFFGQGQDQYLRIAFANVTIERMEHLTTRLTS
ncbi:aminotransferase [Granulosicoccus sp. 3-233]|uniref:aminotransferase n=1 Tax=Granulosicoccus sp. 3-233 TaxID=3417969 RepID=UPI003D3593F7